MCLPVPGTKKPGLIPNRAACVGLAIALAEIVILSLVGVR